MIVLFGNNTIGGISSVMGERYVKPDDQKLLYTHAKNLYGHSMSQPLHYDESKVDRNVNLKEIIKTPDDSDIE